jgi:hypothetical protein
MVRHGLRAVRVPNERRCRNFRSGCKPLNKQIDRLFQLGECNAGVTKQRELDGEADAIGIPAAFRHKVLVGPRQSKTSCHAVGIERDAKKRLALIVGQQLSVRHHCPPVDGPDRIGSCPSNER